MKIEKLDYGYGKKMVKIAFLCGFILCAFVLILINYYVSKAAYRKTQSVQLANGTVNYSLVDFEVVEIKIDDEPSETMPSGNYKLLDTSYCTTKNSQNEDEEDSNIKLTYSNGILNVTPYTKKGTKCHLFFNKLTAESTIADLGLKPEETEIGNIIGPSCNQEKCYADNSVNSMQQNGLYETEDDDGKSYIFRGTVDNNWVKFGKDKSNQDIWWRIIRINGDGTIRMIYSGATSGNSLPSPTGSSTNALIKIAFNNTIDDNTYVGYYIGAKGQKTYDLTHTNAEKSTIASEIDTWFVGTNLDEEAQLNHIDENAGFCNDRKVANNNHGNTTYLNTGYGTDATMYVHDRVTEPSVDRWGTIQNPTLKCAQKDKDLFTILKSNQGNQVLEYPVGLITVDEVILAGGFAGQKNNSYWLYTEQDYWTMSPCTYTYGVHAFSVDNHGYLLDGLAYTPYGVRPVINLKPDNVTLQNPNRNDKGTTSNPYIVSD